MTPGFLLFRLRAYRKRVVNMVRKLGNVYSCSNCEDSFVLTHSVQQYCKKCSDEISREKAMVRNATYRKRKGATNLGEKLVCIGCEKEFVKTHNVENYCDPCKKIKHRLQRRRSYMKSYYRKQRNDPIIVLKTRLRNTLNQSFRRMFFGKGSATEAILGCSWEFFASHVEQQFTEGMNFDNHGDWELDHIVPLSSAKTIEEVVKLNHYTNIRPLWKNENRKKGAKLDW